MTEAFIELCRSLVKKPLLSYRALNRDPMMLEVQNRGFLISVPKWGGEGHELPS